MRYLFIMILFLGVFFSKAADSDTRLMRFPAINGDQVVFSYAGDLYTVDAEGGTARRLTSHAGYEMFPRFSPDGQWIAFTAQYDGNTEVYKIPAEGGRPERLTYTATLSRDDISDRMGPNNIVMGWTPDGKHIIYRSRRYSFNSFIGQLFLVPAEGGLSSQIPLSEGGFCSYDSSGEKLAFNKVFREFRTWKYYRGGMADDIWIYDKVNDTVSTITSSEHQDIIPMWHENTIYFLSDREWTMNLYAYDFEKDSVIKKTNFNDFDIKFPSLGEDRIIFEKGGFIYVYDIEQDKIKKLTINIPNDFLYSRATQIDASEDIMDASLSPNGTRIAISARGDVYSVPSDNGFTRNLTRSSGVHDRNASWSPNGKYIAYFSDKSGEDELYICDPKGENPPVQLTEGDEVYKFSLEWSPDSKKILWNDRDFNLKYVNIESKEVFLVDQAERNQIEHFEWSPDNKWITYSKLLEKGMEQVFLYNTEKEKHFPVTDPWYHSTNPVFDKQGKFLFFTSERDFDPVFSQIEWNYAYVDMSRIYFIPLAKDTPDPFALENDEVDEEDEEDEEENEENEENEDEEQEMKVDVEQINSRVIDLPVKASNYFNLYADGMKIYYYEKSTVNNGISIKMYDMDEEEEVLIGKGMRFRFSPDGEKMLIKKDKKLMVIDPPDSEISFSDPVDLSGMETWVDYKDEWTQIFQEAWRQMRDFFYVENMHGLDWEAVREKYEVFLPYVHHRDDLNYMIGEMIGELNAGHAYINSGDRPDVERIHTGLLGARLDKHESGYFKITRILDGNNWEDARRSPLKAVGLDINEGDYILSVNGQDTREVKNFYRLMVGKAGKQVAITVNDQPSPKGAHQELIKPLKEEESLYYHNWVKENIRQVNEATDGQVGYVHIPDMLKSGLNQFVRNYYPQLTKKGLIIDDRGNGGGNVSPMIVERLRREVMFYAVRRGAKEARPKPEDAFSGHMALLINEFSASDGDLFAHAFKQHEMGPVIGTRTWGGVVGIYGSLPFIDGSTSLRKPEVAHVHKKTGEWIIEGEGVEPDIKVINNPREQYKGNDQQLQRAIDEVMKKIEQDPVQKPPMPDPPVKTNPRSGEKDD